MTQQQAIQQIEKELNIELQKADEIEWNTKVYQTDKQNNIIALSLFGCEIKDIKRVISPLKDLKQLTDLRLDKNQISDISTLKDLKLLTYLILEDNEISDISPLKDLKQLERLVLLKNPIKILPNWIVDFPKMDIRWIDDWGFGSISLYDNPLEQPPVEIVKQGKEAIRNYFEQLSGGEEYLYEAKLILVGEERAGKSTIAKALTQQDFKINLEEKSTEGIDIIKWIIPKDKVNTDRDYRFNIWDFGGQEIYHSTHQFFLTKRSLYLFVTEARKDIRFEDFYYWLNIINSLAGNSPVLLVQNKTDQSHNEIDIADYKKLFPQIYDGLQKVSCNTEHKQWQSKYKAMLNLLKQSIYDIVRNKKIEGIGDLLPKKWVDIRHEIAEIQNKDIKYFSITEYYKICEKYNLNRKEALHLSDYFHDLGVFLHFKDDLQLRSIIFLNHEWLTKAIYKVFDNEEIKNKTHGKFTDKDLIKIWDEPQYEGKTAELLNLMKNPKFKICYQHKDGYYLAPQLFATQKPSFTWQKDTEALGFTYSYEFMPKGILSQLIVMLHKYIKKDIFWKYGVLLEHKNTEALIKENRTGNENTISIEVKGEAKQNLLSTIGNAIEEINSSYTNLKVTEKIACNCSKCKESENPFLWELKIINSAMNAGVKEVQCLYYWVKVPINGLLGNYIPAEQIEKYEKDGVTNITNIYGNNNTNYQGEEQKLITDYLNSGDAEKLISQFHKLVSEQHPARFFKNVNESMFHALLFNWFRQFADKNEYSSQIEVNTAGGEADFIVKSYPNAKHSICDIFEFK